VREEVEGNKGRHGSSGWGIIWAASGWPRGEEKRPYKSTQEGGRSDYEKEEGGEGKKKSGEPGCRVRKRDALLETGSYAMAKENWNRNKNTQLSDELWKNA